jgi:O-antigen/teichoic acid export membrane protein
MAILESLRRYSQRKLVRRVAHGLAWGVTAEVAAKGSLFLVTIYLAGILGAADYGHFAFLQTLFVFVWMGVDLGLNMYSVREVARHPDEVSELAADITGMRLSLAVVLSVVATLAVWLAGGDAVQFWMACGFALYLLVRAVQPDWLLRGLERYRELAVVNLGMAALLLLATWAMIRDAGDAKLASLPWFLSYLLGTIGMAAVLSVRVPGIDWSSMRVAPRRWLGHWRESIHFTLSNGVASLHQNIPVLFVYAVGTASMTGLFAAPYRLVVALVYVSSVVPAVMYPVFTDLHSRGRRNLLGKLTAAMSLSVLAGAGLVTGVAFVQAEALVQALFGAEYRASAEILRWLCVFLLLRSLRAVFVRVVSAGGNQRQYSTVSFVSVAALLALIGLFALAGFEPPLAASAALTICEVGVVAAMAVLAMRTIAQESAWQSERLREP